MKQLKLRVRYDLLKRTECYRKDPSNQSAIIYSDLRALQHPRQGTFQVIDTVLYKHTEFNLFETTNRSAAEAELIVRATDGKTSIITFDR